MPFAPRGSIYKHRLPAMPKINICMALKLDRVKLGKVAGSRVDGFIDELYSTYPRNPINPSQFAMVFGQGDDQQIAVFDIRPSTTMPNTAVVHWTHAYPRRQGVGTKAFKLVQDVARRHGVSLELFPWQHGPVSQAGLMKFYRKQGFEPLQKRGKQMVWKPSGTKD